MCTPRGTLKEQKIFTFEEMHAQKAHASTSNDTCQLHGPTSSSPSSVNWNSFMPMLYIPLIYQESMNLQSFNLHLQDSTMDISQYWPFAWEYSVWNAAFAALQFWMADLKLHILSNAIDFVYIAFFCGDFTLQM